MYKNIFKPVLDIVFSIILIIILLPLFIIVSFITLIDLGFPIIYKQQRVGKNKKAFTIYKFRTMKINNDPDYLRTTKISKVIRNLGLDELPQLFNILKQDMSFVGPRPFILNEKLPDDKIDDSIYTVLPGVVSLAISKGRRDVSHKERLNYDVLYVKNMNLIVDIKIILETIKVIILQNVKR